jgi:2-dehydropantoate 2-reductase
VKICILGAGGLGSVIGGRLAETGVDVTLVARPAHVDAINRAGLRITGTRGDAVVTEHLRAVTDADAATGEFDYTIVLVKATDSEATLAESGSLGARSSAVLSLQNTVVKEAVLADWVGRDKVIGASTTEAGTLEGPGVVRHVATAPTACYFGEVGGGSSPRVEALVSVMNDAGIASKPADDIGHVEWEKLLQISVVAAWSVSTFGALGGSMAEGLVVREAAEHYIALATELFAVYSALGFAPEDFFAPFSQFRRFGSSSFAERVDDVMELGASMRAQGFVGRPSLHDDLLRGRATEVDFSIGAFLAESTRLDIDVPTVRAAYRVIKSLEFWLQRTGGVVVHPLPNSADPADPGAPLRAAAHR